MSIKERKQFWDNQALRWSSHEPFGDLRWDIERLVCQTTQPFIARLPIDSTVLDLGSGANNHQYFDFNNRPDLKVCGIDLSRAMLMQNQSKWRIQADVRQSLPIGPNTVNLCTSFFLMRYLSEQEQKSLLKEIKRILRPNSWFLTIDLPENRWEQQLSVFDPVRMAETARRLEYENVSGEIHKRTYSVYTSSGFGGWNETVNYSYGVLMGRKK